MDYQEEGLLLEPNDYLARSPLDTTAYGNMFGTYAIDDRYYGLPTRCTCWVLYYNKDLFDEAGIAYPEQMTWDEYASLAKQLTNDKTGEDKVWGGYFADWDIAPMPVFKGQDLYSTWGQYQFAGIASKSRHPEEAFEFLSWLCGEDGTQIIAGSGNISGYMNDEIQEIYRDSLPVICAAKNFLRFSISAMLSGGGECDIVELYWCQRKGEKSSSSPRHQNMLLSIAQ